MANDDDTTITPGNESVFDSTSARPSLVVLSSPGAGQLYVLDNSEYVIGRDPSCSIVFEDEGVSRQHARITLREKEVTLTDLGSRNGTFVNGERITERVLSNGDRLRLGKSVIVKLTYNDELDEQFQKHLFELATTDSLTCLFNRRYFLETLRKEFTHALRHARPLSVLLFDVDHFKGVNDTFGHPAADQVLADLAKVMVQHARNEDVVARYGGEEFIVLLRDCPAAEASAFAERVRAAVEQLEVRHEQCVLKITVSAGIATLESHNVRSVDELIQVADENLYRAKHEGRNRTCAAVTVAAKSSLS